MRHLLQRTIAVILLAASACAHAPVPASPPAEVVWPAAPAAPRARLAAVVPDRSVRLPPLPLWRRVLRAIVGLETRSREEEAFQRPFAIAVEEPSGDLVVADPDAPAVLRARPGGRPSPIRCRGREWGAPMALAFSGDGSLFVADAGAGDVVRVSPDGTCVSFGSGALERPTGVAVAGDTVYVTDAPRHEVVVLTSSGVLSRFGTRGEDEGQLSFPTAIAAAPDGTLLVVDALNFRVARFSRDGRWLGSFGERGEEGGAFARPKCVAVDGGGRIYVSDAQRDLVLVFGENASFEYAIGASGEDRGSFAHPAGIHVRAGKLYVADSFNRRVQVFELLGDRS